MTGPIHGAHHRPQIAVPPPEEHRIGGRLALGTFMSVEKPYRRTPWPRLGEREVAGDGIDREEA